MRSRRKPLAAGAALQWLAKRMVESDSLLLVTAVNIDNSYHSTVGLIIQYYK